MTRVARLEFRSTENRRRDSPWVIASRMSFLASSARCLVRVFLAGELAGLALSLGSRCRSCYAHDQTGRGVPRKLA